MVSRIQSTNRAYHCRRNSTGTTENRKNLSGERRVSVLSSALCSKEKAGRFLKEQIIRDRSWNYCRLSNRRRHDRVSWVLPRRWRNYSALLAVMNKQPTLEPDGRKRPSRPKLHDLPPKKDLKGGSSAKSVASAIGSSGIPTSLQEFLKRDSLPIKSD
jgi:hypothetical protein